MKTYTYGVGKYTIGLERCDDDHIHYRILDDEVLVASHTKHPVSCDVEELEIANMIMYIFMAGVHSGVRI